MKRIAYLLIALCACCSTGRMHAQQTFEKSISVGFTGGATFSRVSFQPKVQQAWHQGIVGGVMMRWITEKNLGVQAEILYSRQGWKEDFPDSPEYKYSRDANYIEVPFLTHIYFGSGRFKAFVNLGPYLGYMMSQSTDSNLNGASPNKTNDQHDMDITKKLEWGVGGGPGIGFNTPIGSFEIEARYMYSFGDLYSTKREDVFSKASMQTISAKICYFIPIRKYY